MLKTTKKILTLDEKVNILTEDDFLPSITLTGNKISPINLSANMLEESVLFNNYIKAVEDKILDERIIDFAIMLKNTCVDAKDFESKDSLLRHILSSKVLREDILGYKPLIISNNTYAIYTEHLYQDKDYITEYFQPNYNAGETKGFIKSYTVKEFNILQLFIKYKLLNNKNDVNALEEIVDFFNHDDHLKFVNYAGHSVMSMAIENELWALCDVLAKHIDINMGNQYDKNPFQQAAYVLTKKEYTYKEATLQELKAFPDAKAKELQASFEKFKNEQSPIEVDNIEVDNNDYSNEAVLSDNEGILNFDVKIDLSGDIVN